ncbi:MAG TPA: ATP-binding cassette domain-containing protein [Blastocatellia bacterium]|nr:ATP-binding cassette domain-containing protein [Blastocatellia bacterium]
MKPRAVSPIHSTEYLQARDVTISFDTPRGKFTAVKSIGLTIARGEIVALIGHSGCGKSTILNAMTNGPEATIGEIIEVPIPRPRDKREIVHLKEYVEIHDRMLYLLMDAFADHHRPARTPSLAV